jgi:acyl-CoA thioester hydrolase
VTTQTKELSSTTTVRVRYAETDQMAVVYYANYYVWMEVARVGFCEAVGIRYKTMEAEDGILLAVTESSCRHLTPARYDDTVAIETRLADVSPRAVTFEYVMTCEGRKVATGRTRHIFLNRQFRPTRLPEKYRALFGMDSE